MLDSHMFVVTTAANRRWAVFTMSSYAEQEARRLRRMHKQMQIAFPLPIQVWAETKLPYSRSNGHDAIRRKSIAGPWERQCRCCHL